LLQKTENYKVALFLSDFYQNWNASANFSKTSQYKFFQPFSSCLIHSDRQTGQFITGARQVWECA